MKALNLVKGQTLDLKKADGSSISKIRVGLSWDVKEGITADLDLFIVEKANGAKKVAYYNARTAITGVELSEDNRTGAGDGDDEFVKMDATKSGDGEYFICVNIYTGNVKFSDVANAKATVYNQETNEVLATYVLAQGGAHTAVVVGKVVDSGDNYAFTAMGDYIDGDISQVAESL